MHHGRGRALVNLIARGVSYLTIIHPEYIMIGSVTVKTGKKL